MPKILDFQIQLLSAGSYFLTVCEQTSFQRIESTTFSHHVDFLTDFSVDRLNEPITDPAERFNEVQKLGRGLYQKLPSPASEQVWTKYKSAESF